MTTSLTVNAGDFDEIKGAFKDWLITQPQFADYDFNGSNMSVLLGLLAYNTYLNMFYHNMVSNETFIDTAVRRDSVVSRAKELNYVPRSFKSASATVDVEITSPDITRASVIIPKGTLFTARIADRSYSFTTDRAYVTTESVIIGSTIKFTARNVELLEGFYLTETVPYESGKFIVIPNEQVDTSSISVASIEDNGGAVIPYKRAYSLFDLNSTSQVFFLQGSTGSKYEVGFGDAVFGRKPKNNSLVTIDYRVSNGELPNGVQLFQAGQGIDGETAINVVTITPAHSGSVFESADSIRLNAPRHFVSQGNAVTADDYVSLLQETFPEIISMIAYGGEEATPPLFGRVIISIVLNGIDYLPISKERQFYDFLRKRSLMKPVFVEPQFIYAQITSSIHYDLRKTTINPDDIKTLVLNAIMSYSTTSLNAFGGSLRYSRLGTEIDNAHSSIRSNETTVKLIRELTDKDWNQGSFSIDFGTPLVSLTSQSFYFDGNLVVLKSSGSDILLVNVLNGLTVRPVGVINYSTGVISLSTFVPDNTALPLKVYVVPDAKNISASLNTIIKIRESDVSLTVVKD